MEELHHICVDVHARAEAGVVAAQLDRDQWAIDHFGKSQVLDLKVRSLDYMEIPSNNFIAQSVFSQLNINYIQIIILFLVFLVVFN